MSSVTFGIQRFLKGFVVGLASLGLLLATLFGFLIDEGVSGYWFGAIIAAGIALGIGFQVALEPYVSEGHDDEFSWYDRYRAWKMCYSRWEMFWKTWVLSVIPIFLLGLAGIQNSYLMSSLDPGLGDVLIYAVVLSTIGAALRTAKYWNKLP